MSWERDLMSWERDNYVVGTRSYVVGTRQIIFFTCPLSAAVGIVRGKKSFSGHHCMSGIYNIGHCVMTW